MKIITGMIDKVKHLVKFEFSQNDLNSLDLMIKQIEKRKKNL